MVDPIGVAAAGIALVALGWQVMQWRMEQKPWAVPELSCSIHEYEGSNYAVVDCIVTNKGTSNLHLTDVALFAFKGKPSTSNLGLSTIWFPASSDLTAKGFDFFIEHAEWYDMLPEFTHEGSFLGKDEKWSHHRLIPLSEKGFYKIFLYVATKAQIWSSAEKVLFLE